MTNLENLKFPIGEFLKPKIISEDQIRIWSEGIASFPDRLEKAVTDLSKEELMWVYRPEGWNILQVVHHCADSHMNAFIRFKLTLTEDSPFIKPYLEASWAEMPDVLDHDLSDSLLILKGVHARWVKVILSMEAKEFNKEYVHPEHDQRFSLAEAIGIYSWHCNHHLAHVKQAIRYRGTFIEKAVKGNE